MDSYNTAALIDGSCTASMCVYIGHLRVSSVTFYIPESSLFPFSFPCEQVQGVLLTPYKPTTPSHLLTVGPRGSRRALGISSEPHGGGEASDRSIMPGEP